MTPEPIQTFVQNSEKNLQITTRQYIIDVYWLSFVCLPHIRWKTSRAKKNLRDLYRMVDFKTSSCWSSKRKRIPSIVSSYSAYSQHGQWSHAPVDHIPMISIQIWRLDVMIFCMNLFGCLWRDRSPSCDF